MITILQNLLIFLFLVSGILSNLELTPPPSSPVDLEFELLLDIINNDGSCVSFGQMLVQDDAVSRNLSQAMQTGLTIFAPIEKAISTAKLRLPDLSNVTVAVFRQLVQYYMTDVYLSPKELKRDGKRIRTLARNHYTGQFYSLTVRVKDPQLLLETAVGGEIAEVVGEVSSVEGVAIYKINKVLVPPHIFETPGPPPSPSPVGAYYNRVINVSVAVQVMASAPFMFMFVIIVLSSFMA